MHWHFTWKSKWKSNFPHDKKSRRKDVHSQMAITKCENIASISILPDSAQYGLQSCEYLLTKD